jgi:hypothetical protein
MDLVFYSAKTCAMLLVCVLQLRFHPLLASFWGSCKKARWREFVPYRTPSTVYGIVELRIVDVQFIRINSHDGPVYLVEPVGFKHRLASRPFEYVEVELVPSCHCSKFRAKKFRKRVEVETIDRKTNAIEDRKGD